MTGYATGRVAGLRAGKKPECESLKRDVRKMEAEEKDEEVKPKMVKSGALQPQIYLLHQAVILF
jgi:hypothetical protein